MTLEKLRISRIFEVFSIVVSGTKIKPKVQENDREGVYMKIGTGLRESQARLFARKNTEKCLNRFLCRLF